MRHRFSAFATLTLLLTASTTLAQLGGGVAEKDKKYDPPTATFKSGTVSEVGPMLWTVVLLALVVGANLIPTKRGHQD